MIIANIVLFLIFKNSLSPRFMEGLCSPSSNCIYLAFSTSDIPSGFGAAAICAASPRTSLHSIASSTIAFAAVADPLLVAIALAVTLALSAGSILLALSDRIAFSIGISSVAFAIRASVIAYPVAVLINEIDSGSAFDCRFSRADSYSCEE
jgi:hypothetical protein